MVGAEGCLLTEAAAQESWLRARASARLRPNGFSTTTWLRSGSPTVASAWIAGAKAAGGSAR